MTMEKPLTFSSFYFLSSILFLLNIILLVKSNGLTLRLIHPSSRDHPFFQSNLSQEERIRTLVSKTNKNTTYLTKTSSALVQPQISMQSYSYVVKIGIGTFKTKPSYKEYYLVMDTGSTITWMQCQGCTVCFYQTPSPFPKEKSSSFHPILNENNRIRNYYQAYAGGTSTHGILGEETLSLRSSTGVISKVEKFQFGCGLNNKMIYWAYKNNTRAGILGLGWGHKSFQNQIFFQSRGKFSYCLPTFARKNTVTYLRFGNDIIQPQTSKTTPLYSVGETSPESSIYFVEVLGISLNKTRLNISPDVFAIRNNGRSGGCAFDSGTPYSRIIKPAYDALISELVTYFSRFRNLRRFTGGDLGLDLCYQRTKAEGYNNLPDITFHLRGSNADFVMKAEAVFEVVSKAGLFGKREYFCLAFVPNNERSVIGAHQQTNQRIIYDNVNKQLLFNPENCSN